MVTGKKNLIQGICYIFILSHFAIGFVRFLLGFNTLPLITAERNPSQELSDLFRNDAISKAISITDSKGRSFLHWGERRILILREKIFFQGNFHLMLIISCVELKPL